MQKSVRLFPVCIYTLLSRFVTKFFYFPTYLFYSIKLRLCKRSNKICFLSGLLYLFNYVFIRCNSPWYVVICCLLLSTLNLICKYGNVLIYTWVVTFPPKPTMFARLQTGHGRCGGGNCGRKKYGLVYTGQMRPECSIFFKMSFKNAFPHTV